MLFQSEKKSMLSENCALLEDDRVTTLLLYLIVLILSWVTYKGKFGIINKMDNVSWSVIITDVKADNLSAYIAL